MRSWPILTDRLTEEDEYLQLRFENGIFPLQVTKFLCLG
jgi:hypothetical protein